MAIDRIGISGASGVWNSPDLIASRAAQAGGAHESGAGAATGSGESGAGGIATVREAVARAAARLGGAQKATADATRVASALDDTRSLLDEIRTLLSKSTDDRRDDVAGIRDRIAGIAASIRRAEARASGEDTGDATSVSDIDTVALTSGSSPTGFQFGFVAANIAPGVQNIQGKSLLPPGSVRDVELDVISSAVTAEFQLWFRTQALDLSSPDSQFRIEIGGALGSQTLSFASGTSYDDIAASINSFTSVTGVSARVGPYARIYLSSPPEDGSFVSLRVLDDGGANGGVTGVEGSPGREFDEIDPTEEFRENGSAFHATIAGEEVALENGSIHSKTSEWDLRFDLDLDQYNHAGSYHLFLLFATNAHDINNEPPPPEFDEPIQLGLSAAHDATEVAEGAATGEASAEAVDTVADLVSARRDALRALLDGPLADARASAEAALRGVIANQPRAGWSVDAIG